MRHALITLLFLTSGPALARTGVEILEVRSGSGDGTAAPASSPAGGGSGPAPAPASRPAPGTFLELVRRGTAAFDRYSELMGRKTRGRTEAPARAIAAEAGRSLDLARALFKKALAMRESGQVRRDEVGAALHVPELSLGLIHFYWGNHGAALANLRWPLAQRVPAGADVATASAIRAQKAKALDLRRRLLSPFLPAFRPVAQVESNTCGTTAAFVALTGYGAKLALALGDRMRQGGNGSLDQIARIGLAMGRAGGVPVDAAWSERRHPDPADSESSLPARLDPEGLRDVVCRGYPVLVSARDYLDENKAWRWPNGHYLLLIGAKSDESGKVRFLYTLDSSGGGVHRRFERTEFEETFLTNGRGAVLFVPRHPARRFRARLGVRTMHDAAATSPAWAGKPQTVRAD